jgi:hypothetical protein
MRIFVLSMKINTFYYLNMKKLLTVLLTIACLLSCEGPIGSLGEETHMFYTVEAKDWQLVGRPDAPNSFYQYSFTEPSLTKFIYEEGLVVGYVVANPGTRNEMLRPLPDTWPVGDDHGATWTESVTFDYMPGLVTFYVGYSDFATTVSPPRMVFKIMMIW